MSWAGRGGELLGFYKSQAVAAAGFLVARVPESGVWGNIQSGAGGNPHLRLCNETWVLEAFFLRYRLCFQPFFQVLMGLSELFPLGCLS